jgi:hypothetical protein
MSNEDRYRECLLHVIEWLGGRGELGHLQALAGRNTHRIVCIVDLVLAGSTVEQAVKDTQ